MGNKLENIGFYTLSDYRASQSSIRSPLWRCELILTDSCNFNCVYCRGLRSDIKGTMSFNEAMKTLDIWCDNGLKNVRFSGGEPTLYKGLDKLVEYCKNRNVEHIAISTNGSASWDLYKDLIEAGVNDFSVSLDSCCASVQDKMAGGISVFDRISENIKKLSDKVYTTVGVVVNEQNIDTCVDTVIFADSLGVSDIRIIPSAQYNKLLTVAEGIPQGILDKYPILAYRVFNIKKGCNVRGISGCDSHKCWLAMDDMAVAGGYHFPCIIYMREQGDPIGKITSNVREDRFKWFMEHDTHLDPICRGNCLDVCVDYNNKVENLRGSPK